VFIQSKKPARACCTDQLALSAVCWRKSVYHRLFDWARFNVPPNT